MLKDIHQAALLMAITSHVASIQQSAIAGDPQIVARLPGHAESVTSIAISPDGKLVATGDVYKIYAVRLWDAHDGRHLKRLVEDPISLVGFLPSSNALLTCGEDAVDVWDLRGEIAKTRSLPHPSRISGIALSRDGKKVATGVARPTEQGLRGELRLWTFEPWEEQVSFVFPEASAVQSVTFNPQATLVAALEVRRRKPGSSIRIVDVEQRRIVRTLPPADGSGELVVSQNLLVSIGLTELHVWDVANWRKVQVLTATPEEGHWHVGAFSPDGKILAVGGFRQIFLWDTATWKSLPPLRADSGRVIALDFSADGKLLASGTTDRTAILWRLSDPPEDATTQPKQR